MKRILPLVLALAMLLALLAACNREQAPDPQPSTTAESYSTTTVQSDTTASAEPPSATTTEPYIEPLTGSPLVPATSSAMAKTPGPLTNEQAKALAVDLAARAWDIIVIFDGDSALNFEVVPERQHRRILDNAFGIHDIASLKAVTERVYTKEYARSQFYRVEEGADASKNAGQYYEENGVLYGRGGGMDGGLFEVAAVNIKSQTADTLVMDLDVSGGYYMDASETIGWRLKWEGGAWKLDCHLFGLDVPQV